MKENKNILIVTIQSQNYGNRLQNYALQEYLVSLGYSVRSLSNGYISTKEKLKKYIKSQLDYLRLFPSKNYRWESFDRKIKFDMKSNDSYDCYIAGSDQIWNPYFHFNSDREFLTFAPLGKRIAYAGSIGLDELPTNVVERYTENFNSFTALSCREIAGANIIKSLTGSEVPVVVDPTMLLTKETWTKFTQESRIKLNEKFIVKYFLGSKNKKFDIEIDLYAKKNGIKVVDIFDSNTFSSKIGPIEFVWLLANSEYNFVDSFHGAVFSILFGKKFFVFDRPSEKGTGNMRSRIDTLLSTFELEHLLLTEEDQLNLSESKIEYSTVNRILEQRRIESSEYLSKSIMSL